MDALAGASPLPITLPCRRARRTSPGSSARSRRHPDRADRRRGGGLGGGPPRPDRVAGVRSGRGRPRPGRGGGADRRGERQRRVRPPALPGDRVGGGGPGGGAAGARRAGRGRAGPGPATPRLAPRALRARAPTRPRRRSWRRRLRRPSGASGRRRPSACGAGGHSQPPGPGCDRRELDSVRALVAAGHHAEARDRLQQLLDSDGVADDVRADAFHQLARLMLWDTPLDSQPVAAHIPDDLPPRQMSAILAVAALRARNMAELRRFGDLARRRTRRSAPRRADVPTPRGRRSRPSAPAAAAGPPVAAPRTPAAAVPSAACRRGLWPPPAAADGASAVPAAAADGASAVPAAGVPSAAAGAPPHLAPPLLRLRQRPPGRGRRRCGRGRCRRSGRGGCRRRRGGRGRRRRDAGSSSPPSAWSPSPSWWWGSTGDPPSTTPSRGCDGCWPRPAAPSPRRRRCGAGSSRCSTTSPGPRPRCSPGPRRSTSPTSC